MGSIGISGEAKVMDLQMAEWCDVSLQTATDCTGKEMYYIHTHIIVKYNSTLQELATATLVFLEQL